MVYTPQTVVFPAGTQRVSERPTAYRDERYEVMFDFDTMFYDCIGDEQRVILLGPPLNVTPSIEFLTVHDHRDGRELPAEMVDMSLHCQIRVSAPADTEKLRITWSGGEITASVSRSRPVSFAGRRVLLTMSRDNEIDWILDWVRFHRDAHGADAVLLYDNSSTRYTAEDVERALLELHGIAAVHVVSWPYKYGPQGFRDLGFWDSNFGQPGALEHARRFFLHDAASVMNSDIDELVVGSRWRRSVFRAAERSRFGIVRYIGCWIAPIPKAGGSAPMRHQDFSYRTKVRFRRVGRSVRPEVCQPKWTVVPAMCPDRSQWHIHDVRGREAGAAPLTPEFAYRHFRALSTGWKYDRAAAERFSRSAHRFDRAWRRWSTGVRWDV